MLKVRIIPTLLVKNIGLVKGKGFDSWRRVGTVLPAVKVYNLREVDELVIVDITATAEKRGPDYDEIRRIAQECFVPVTFGGGIHSVEQMRQLFCAGADKVCINSAAYERPDFVTEVAERFGSQSVMVAVDAKRGTDGHYECFSHSGQRATGIDVVTWCQRMQAAGAGEILLTSIERDGTMCGYDLELIKLVASGLKIPLIASGGAGVYDDMHQALCAGANAVAAAAMFHYTEHTPLGAKQFLAKHGIQVRKSYRNDKSVI